MNNPQTSIFKEILSSHEIDYETYFNQFPSSFKFSIDINEIDELVPELMSVEFKKYINELSVEIVTPSEFLKYATQVGSLRYGNFVDELNWIIPTAEKGLDLGIEDNHSFHFILRGKFRNGEEHILGTYREVISLPNTPIVQQNNLALRCLNKSEVVDLEKKIDDTNVDLLDILNKIKDPEYGDLSNRMFEGRYGSIERLALILSKTLEDNYQSINIKAQFCIKTVSMYILFSTLTAFGISQNRNLVLIQTNDNFGRILSKLFEDGVQTILKSHQWRRSENNGKEIDTCNTHLLYLPLCIKIANENQRHAGMVNLYKKIFRLLIQQKYKKS